MSANIVTQEIQDSVSSLYIAFFGRAPDARGFGYWAEEQAAGVSPFDIAANFARSEEWISNYGGLTPTQQVTLFYNNVFDRDPDTAGLNYWVAEINGGTPVSEVAYQIIWAAYLGGEGVDPDDNAIVLNKIAVAEYFAIDLKSNDTDIAATAFDGVTQDEATVQVAEDRLYAEVNPPVTYTLTTDIDTVEVTGTAASEVTGLFATAANNGTYNTGDTINGNGNTTVNLVVNVPTANDQIVVADINNVSAVNVNLAVATDTAGPVIAATVDMSEFDDVAALNVNRGTNGQTLTLENAQLETAYGLTSGRQSNLTITGWDDAVTGTSDAVDLTLGGSGTSTQRSAINVAAGIETYNISTSGTNRVSIQSNPAAATTETSYVVTGSGTNNVQFLAAEVGTYDFSATTGSNTIDLGATLTAADVVAGGSGTDTLSIAPTASINGRLQISGVETLTVNASGTVVPPATTVTVSAGFGDVEGITTINLTAAAGRDATIFAANQLTGVGTINITGLAANAAGANDVNGLTVGGAASTTVNVNVTANVVDAAGLLTLTGVTGLTYAVTGDADNFSATLGGVTATGLTSLTVTTAGFDDAADELNFTVGTVTASGKTVATVDLSGADTGVSVAFAAASLADSAVITGGSGYDVINASAVSLSAATKKITIIGGEGADTMTAIDSGNGLNVFQIAEGDTGITAATADLIDEFLSGADDLKLGVAGDATATTGNFVSTNAAGFTAALVAANAALDTLSESTQYSQTYAFVLDTGTDDGWLFIDWNADGSADGVVTLTDLTDVGTAPAVVYFAAGDIIA